MYMSMASKTHLSLLLLAATMASLAGPSAGVFHIIGAGKGWRIPPTPTYYADWSRTRNVTVGDKLMFMYRSGVYDIVEVPTKELFDKCSMDNVTHRYQLGPTILKINVPGPRFYFCGVGKHCEQGQKVAIDVSPAAADAAATDANAPATAGAAAANANVPAAAGAAAADANSSAAAADANAPAAAAAAPMTLSTATQAEDPAKTS